jgi:3-oxoacyl-[acyl-carrier-protein] synthase II
MQNGRRRVVITGIGAVTPIGITVGDMWAGLRREQSAIRNISTFDPTPFRSHNAAEVRGFVATDFLERKRAKRLDRFGHFSVACARLAIEDAGLDLAKENRERIGATMGSALGGVGYAEQQFGVFLKEGIDRVEPQLALNVFIGAASCNVAIEFGLMGPNSTNGMSCASGTIGVGDAFRLVRDDYADAMLCGGVEAPLMPLCFAAFTIIRAMSTRNDDPERSSRPFDKGRDGFVMGEGGTVLVLEEYERARARGARIYAEIVGYGNSNDAHHMTAPRPDASQAARAMRLALADGHVSPSDVSYVNAHGSSTPLNDPTETAAIRQVFGDHSERLQVSSTKGYYGHALGASGAFEVAISALALERSWLPPTLNLDDPGDGCDLDYIPKTGRNQGVDYILSNSFGFGGINAAVVLKRAD